MRLLCALVLLSSLATAQEDAASVLRKSRAFYADRDRAGVRVYTQRRTDDGDSSTSRYTVYYDRSKQLAQQLFDNASSFYIRTKDSSYSISPEKKIYGVSAGGVEAWYWNIPAIDTRRVFGGLQAYFVRKDSAILSSTAFNLLQLRVNTNTGFHSVLFDPHDYRILKIEDEWADETTKRYTCMEFEDLPFQDSLSAMSELLASSISRYSRLVPPVGWSEREQEKRIDSLGHVRLDRAQLVALLDTGSGFSVADDKYILLDFFFQGCLPCREAFPGLSRIAASGKSVKVVGIDRDRSDIPRMTAFIKKLQIGYPVVMGDRAEAVHRLLYGDLQALSYPTVLLINPAGKVVKIWVGYSEGMDKQIERKIK